MNVLATTDPRPKFKNIGVELVHRHAGQRGGENFLKVPHRELGHCLLVAGEHGLERFDVLEFRPLVSGIKRRTLLSSLMMIPAFLFSLAS
ncbi:MAG: hypothetical protein AUI16_27315 [Alphaproteobacteria bacterium 13_2_20CM_2_64_7]|nr:MAG: hypothetical protein AUI16_27315 [Alphaproteobacteria bacterium 13_2_20CM_2_64_7]